MDKAEATEHTAVIRTEGLTKRFDDVVAVDAITFEVPAGQIFGLIGPSGCGKTTTVRLLTGVYRPTKGRAIVLGAEPSHFSNAMRARIGYMPQQSVLYPSLSVWENLRFAASVYGVDPFDNQKLFDVLTFVEMEAHRHKQVSDISGGMRRRLSLAASLVHEPTLLFLDEPTGGVDPVLRRKFWNHFESLRDEQRTLFVTTQYVGEAAHCDLVGVMMTGKLMVVDTPDGLRRRAFDGETINVRSKHPLSYSATQDLREVAGIRRVIRIGDADFRLVVDAASTVTPRIMNWAEAYDVEIQSVKEYKPPFDDVFVRLIEGNSGSEAGEEDSDD